MWTWEAVHMYQLNIMYKRNLGNVYTESDSDYLPFLCFTGQNSIRMLQETSFNKEARFEWILCQLITHLHLCCEWVDRTMQKGQRFEGGRLDRVRLCLPAPGSQPDQQQRFPSTCWLLTSFWHHLLLHLQQMKSTMYVLTPDPTQRCRP